jgi:hypothetical protein
MPPVHAVYRDYRGNPYSWDDPSFGGQQSFAKFVNLGADLGRVGDRTANLFAHQIRVPFAQAMDQGLDGADVDLQRSRCFFVEGGPLLLLTSKKGF